MTAGDGKPCKKCGTSEWYRCGNCKQCQKESARQWQKDNPEKAAANTRRWQKKNPERHLSNVHRWQMENPEKHAEISRRWKRDNPEKVVARKQRWARDNPEKRAAVDNRRRTSKTKAGGSYTAAEWKSLVDHHGGKCLCCGRTDVKLTADHVVPVAKGGSSNIDNIQPLCGRCNSSKKDRIIDYRPGKGLGRWIQRKLFG